jgi:hypothetical protein
MPPERILILMAVVPGVVLRMKTAMWIRDCQIRPVSAETPPVSIAM